MNVSNGEQLCQIILNPCTIVASNGNQHFLFFPQCFLSFPKQISIFESHLFCHLQMLSIWSRSNSLWDNELNQERKWDHTSDISRSILRFSCASFSTLFLWSFSTFSKRFQYTIISLVRRRAFDGVSFMFFCDCMAALFTSLIDCCDT